MKSIIKKIGFVIGVLILGAMGSFIPETIKFSIHEFYWGSVPDWIAAIGTAGALFYAFRQNFQLRRDRDDEYNRSVHPQLKVMLYKENKKQKNSSLFPIGTNNENNGYDPVISIKNISDNPALLMKIFVHFYDDTKSVYVLDRLDFEDGRFDLNKYGVVDSGLNASSGETRVLKVRIFFLTTHRERMLSVFDRVNEGFLYNLNESYVEHSMPANREYRDDKFKEYIYNTLIESKINRDN